MTWVNLGEVAYIVERRRGQSQAQEVLTALWEARVGPVPVGEKLALLVARIKANHPMAYTDAFAAALAIDRDTMLVTGHPEFGALEDSLRIQWIRPT